ncbi:4-hydroxy-3-methylbut-2-enyl diphosphate reductase [Pararhodospirillum oryzae]|uniref:4-hydroxy-3-methylbut-2-enyl diphosphate reductase n=1 Tax=Pararhodospirillum oryzae TaxID=478448 RepID=A0A512HBP3_9PROT|nr:4-hydroxy-3-methylbut-2-enyl diphosphate reductase [Pararhodospirillum oryzae]GEO82874.1 4-hydroxy-3-methylbut-2-enyl diphosphate reductase [Pararhodospirillum oryzae]
MTDERPLRVILANPRGFCAGVTRAIEIVEKCLDLYEHPVYVRHEIVHNKHVVESLRSKGAVFVDELDEIPDGALTVFSAHGVSKAVVDEAARRDLPVVDATCPLVSRVHKEGQNHVAKGREVVMIGHEGHPEVEGTRGQIPGGVHLVSRPEHVEQLPIEPGTPLAYVTQTTLSVDDTREVIKALKERFPTIQGPDFKDICYATQNRQSAVREITREADLLLVVGARNSSNSNRLREIGAQMGKPSYLIDDADGLDPEWMKGVRTVAITAGASAPEALVRALVQRLATFGPVEVIEQEGVDEHMQFKLPRLLQEAERQRLGTPDPSTSQESDL